MNHAKALLWPTIPLQYFFYVAAFVALIVFQIWNGFVFLRSDSLGYANWSNLWWEYVHPFHLPGYPALIWIFQKLTMQKMPVGWTMVAICGLLWSSSILLLRRIFNHLRILNAEYWILLYAFFPFVGLNYVVYPVADSLAHLLLLSCIFCFLTQRAGWFCLSAAIALIVHKVLWPFIFLLSLIFIFSKRYSVWYFLLSGGLLVSYWIQGLLDGKNLLWLVSKNMEVEFLPQSNFFLLDGILGAFETVTLVTLIKASVLISLLLLTTSILLFSIKRRIVWIQGISFSILFLLLFLNQHEIWAATRFSKVLIIPAAIWASQNGWWQRVFVRYEVFAILMAMCVSSQFVYAYYMSAIFFG